MNPLVFALRHPFTVVVALVALAGASCLAVLRMKIDIFPALNLPVVYVAQPYGGMDPAQMEGLITNYYEYHFLYVGGIHHVESKNVQGCALMKLYFHPGTDMAQAMAETIAQVNRSRAFMPPGTVPPFVMRFDTGSVPVGYLVLSSETKTVGQIQDQALFKVRPMFASLPGVSAPPPFGGNQRTVVVRVDPDRLRAYRASPEDVINALTRGNTISPSGNVRIGDRMPIVPTNALVTKPEELGDIPLHTGSNVFLRDLAQIEDGTDIPTGYALVNGRRAVYICVTKRADASTLSVVNEVRKNLPRMQAALPDDIRVSFEFDQSPYVTRSLWNVVLEMALGAGLIGLMVVLFLRDWRSVIVVVLNIPLALLGAVVGLWLTGQSLNLMTLGGLALAVGILVDEATVEVENIHTQLGETNSVARAVQRGNAETAVPRLLAMLCVLAVFTPAFFMQGAARGLFAPLALAVGFAMITSYLLSSTLVPVLSIWLLRRLKHHEEAPAREWTWLGHLPVVRALVALRVPVMIAYVAGTVCFLVASESWVGRDIFPAADAGQFQLRLRAPVGTRIELTEELTRQALQGIEEMAGEGGVEFSLAYIGMVPSSYPVNLVYLWMSGPEESVMRVKLGHGATDVAGLKERLRGELSGRLREWLVTRLGSEGIGRVEAEERARGLRLSFEPADIVNEVMSFGSPTPVEVAVSGPNLDENRQHADRLRAALAGVPALRDLQQVQSLDYPTVEVQVDRLKAAQSGVTAEDVAKSVVAATSSSRFVVPNYWRDPRSGIGYQVQVEIPTARMDSTHSIEQVPIRSSGGLTGGPLLVRDVAGVREGAMPGEYDRYNMRRVISLTANLEGTDLGRVSDQVRAAIASAGEPPRGVEVAVRGQVEPLQQIVDGLTLGLGVALLAIALLLTAYFQSFRLTLVVLLTLPAVLSGVVIALLLTRSTLNLQSFMGAVMALGVGVANAILLVTFAERNRRAGSAATVAAVEAARQRRRPILMTSCAMIAGMIPLALGLGEGGQQMAPLGRAVIGGLIASTLAALLVLPALFALLMGGAGRQSVSLDPDDPDSPEYEAPAVTA